MGGLNENKMVASPENVPIYLKILFHVMPIIFSFTLQVVCGNCSDNKAKLRYLKYKEGRVCDECFRKLDGKY